MPRFPNDMSKEAPLAIFLSPHFDDIALSCGATAARLTRMGACGVGLVVCAAPAPTKAISEYARELHKRWESANSARTGRTINDVRREEERGAMRVLGLEPVWLDVPDAIYRHGATGAPYYTSDEQLFGKVTAEDRRALGLKLVEEINRVAHERAPRGRIRVFAPLGVGRHVDHQLVFWAARRLGPRYGVLFYEDFPYAARPDALEARINELNVMAQPRVATISELIGLKIAAIARYKSQLEVLFGSSEAMPAAVREYAVRIAGGNGCAERFWHIPNAYAIA